MKIDIRKRCDCAQAVAVAVSSKVSSPMAWHHFYFSYLVTEWGATRDMQKWKGDSLLAYSTGQPNTTNLIAPKIDFFGAIRCQDCSQRG